MLIFWNDLYPQVKRFKLLKNTRILIKFTVYGIYLDISIVVNHYFCIFLKINNRFNTKPKHNEYIQY